MHASKPLVVLLLVAEELAYRLLLSLLFPSRFHPRQAARSFNSPNSADTVAKAGA